MCSEKLFWMTIFNYTQCSISVETSLFYSPPPGCKRDEADQSFPGSWMCFNRGIAISFVPVFVSAQTGIQVFETRPNPAKVVPHSGLKVNSSDLSFKLPSTLEGWGNQLLFVCSSDCSQLTYFFFFFFGSWPPTGIKNKSLHHHVPVFMCI